MMLDFEFTYCSRGEEHSNQKVGGPVRTTSHCHGGRAGALAKEFSHNKPGNGAWSNLKEGHINQDSHNADKAHGFILIL